MCISNTRSVQDAPNKKFGKLSASLPFEKLKTITGTGSKSRNTTLMQKLKIVESKQLAAKALVRERDEYFHKIALEEEAKQLRRIRCAILIQAIFRGFRVRPRKPYKRTVKVVTKPSPKALLLEIQDELCDFAQLLSLKPIAGLNLESRGKTSKRRARIESAAAFRITRFFRMILCRKRARRELNEIRNQKLDRSARIVTRFFRLVKLKKWTKNLERENRSKAAQSIQCSIRSFQSRQR